MFNLLRYSIYSFSELIGVLVQVNMFQWQYVLPFVYEPVNINLSPLSIFSMPPAHYGEQNVCMLLTPLGHIYNEWLRCDYRIRQYLELLQAIWMFSGTSWYWSSPCPGHWAALRLAGTLPRLQANAILGSGQFPRPYFTFYWWPVQQTFTDQSIIT